MIKLLRYMKNYKAQGIIAPLFKMLEATFELIVPLVMAQMIDVGIVKGDVSYVYRMGIWLVVFSVLGLSCSLTAQYFAAKAAMNMGKELRLDLFRHIESLSYAELDRMGGATLITRMTSDVNQVQAGVNLILRLFLRSPYIVIGALIMAFTVSKKLSLIFAITVPLLALVIYGVMILTIPLYKKVQERLDTILLSARENLSGIRVVRAFRMQEKEKEEFETENNQLLALQMFAGKLSALLNPATYIVVNAATIAIVWFGGKDVYYGGLKQGEVIALVNYMSQILLAMVALFNLIISATKTFASAGRLNELFDLKPSIESGNNGWEETEDIMVAFEHVGLSYGGSTEEALTDINFEAKKGEVIGIIGGTGSGKSSLVHMIPRFYDASSGCVRVAGRDVREYDLDKLREHIGIVMQKAVLFRGTLRDNMKMGDENITDEQIRRALEIAQAWEIVEKRPEGLDMMIHQNGRNLSGGQKQRFTIARALAKNPDILILDDSTSALDFATDAKLRRALSENRENTTIFLVSQRVTSVMHADRILVLDDGRIVGNGTHEELAEHCEVYQEICHSQLKEEGKHE